MSICSGLAAILNAVLLPAAVTHVHQITYLDLVLILMFDIVASP